MSTHRKIILKIVGLYLEVTNKGHIFTVLLITKTIET